MPAEPCAAPRGGLVEHDHRHDHDDAFAMRRRRRGRLRELAELIREVEHRAGVAAASVDADDGRHVAADSAVTGVDRGVAGSARRAARPAVRSGWREIDQFGLLVRGVVHEWFAIEPRDASLRRSIECSSPPLCILAHLAGAAIDQAPEDAGNDDAHRGRAIAPQIAWIGRQCWPYPRLLIRSRDIGRDHSLDQWGGEDRSMLERSIFIDPPDDAARLWAIDLALRSRALAAVVADGSKLDMAATRRLQLAAEHGGGLALLVRPARELDRLSAASTRWVVRPVSSPGRWPRWSIELRRCKGFMLESTVSGDAAGIARVDASRSAAARPFSLMCSSVSDPLPVLHLPGVELTDATRLVAVSADVVDRSAAAAPPATSIGRPRDRSHAARRSA